MSFTLDPLTELWLDIDPDLQQHCWAQTQAATSPRCRWTWYLNQLCQAALLPWLQDATDGAIAPAEPAYPLAELVPGTVVMLGDKRLILVPSLTLDTSEFSVPQEWVDLPAWAGDYFMAVQIDSDDSTVRVWGYTTHRQLKTQGQYDRRDRAYGLTAQCMVTDLSALWVVQQLNPQEVTQAAIPELEPLTATEAEAILLRLGDRTVLNPRLAVPFPQWGALVSNANLVQRLGALRQEPTTAPAIAPSTQLGQWLQNQIQAGWQTLESLVEPSSELATGFRQTPDLADTAIKRAKRLELMGQAFLLVVGLESEADDRVGVRVQLRADRRAEVLPETLRLSLVQLSGEVVQSVEARSQDNIIQLKRFKCPPGTEFRIQVAIAAIVHTEDFVI